MHVDHVGGMVNFPTLYPQAQFYAQKKEFDFWVNSPLAQRPPFKRKSQSKPIYPERSSRVQV
jgi:glyoxylase-like metal-dependent hydrolase (beta-lactamase superfamily II)